MSLLAICFWIFVFSCFFVIGLDKPKHIVAVFVPNAALVGYNLFSKILMEGRGVETLQGAAVAAIFGAGVLYAWACCARSFHEAEAERLKPWANVGKRAAIMAALVAAFALVFSSCVWWQCLVLGGMASVVLMGFSLLVQMGTTDLHWTKHMDGYDALGAILAAGLMSILLYFAAYLVTYGFATTMTPWPLTAAPFLLSAFACRLAWKSKWSCSAFATCYAICLALMYSGSVWYLNLALVLAGVLADLFVAKGEKRDSDDGEPIADDGSDKDVGCYPAVEDTVDLEVPESVERESLELPECANVDGLVDQLLLRSGFYGPSEEADRIVKRLTEEGVSDREAEAVLRKEEKKKAEVEVVDFAEVVAGIPEAPQDEKTGSSTSLLGVAAIVSLVILMTGCGGMLRSTADLIEGQQDLPYVAFMTVVRDGVEYSCAQFGSPKKDFVCVNRKTKIAAFSVSPMKSTGTKIASTCPAFGKCGG